VALADGVHSRLIFGHSTYDEKDVFTVVVTVGEIGTSARATLRAETYGIRGPTGALDDEFPPGRNLVLLSTKEIHALLQGSIFARHVCLYWGFFFFLISYIYLKCEAHVRCLLLFLLRTYFQLSWDQTTSMITRVPEK